MDGKKRIQFDVSLSEKAPFRSPIKNFRSIFLLGCLTINTPNGTPLRIELSYPGVHNQLATGFPSMRNKSSSTSLFCQMLFSQKTLSVIANIRTYKKNLYQRQTRDIGKLTKLEKIFRIKCGKQRPNICSVEHTAVDFSKMGTRF